MTTEIAVLNRLGIALATDSAVTISGNGKTKVFDSADKLFELSCESPIAIMVNGNMECFGLPWELAIKDFRAEHGSTPRNSVAEWATDFLKFVEAHKYIEERESAEYLYRIASAEIEFIKKQIINIAWRQNKRSPKTVPEVAMLQTLSISQDRINVLAGMPRADSLSDLNIPDVITAAGGDLLQFVEERFMPVEIPDDAKASVVKQIAHAVLAIMQNDHSTGLIVAGYCLNDAFPQLVSFEVEGIIFGRLKYSAPVDKASSSQGPEFGHLVSFAQTDVIERLLMGVDPRFVEESADFIRSAIEDLGTQIANIGTRKRLSKVERKAKSEAIALLSKMSEAKYREAAAQFREVFKRDFEKMVALMPKIELIELAEALVSITAIERKASEDEGTVGGPIDVAFVTKHEGFVWVKRKHYFDPALNPRYFWRKYNLGKRE